MKKTYKVTVPTKGTHTVKLEFHCATTPADLLIGDEFYTTNRTMHDLPEMPHYEMEVLNPEDWSGHFHIHMSQKQGKSFVCWTGQIPDQGAAETVALVWVLGIVFMKETDIDFGRIFSNCQGNIEKTTMSLQLLLGAPVIEID